MQILKQLLLRQTALAANFSQSAQLALKSYAAVVKNGEAAADEGPLPAQKTPPIPDADAPAAERAAEELLLSAVERGETLPERLNALRGRSLGTVGQAAQPLASFQEEEGGFSLTGLTEDAAVFSSFSGGMEEISRFFERDARRYGG